VKGQKTVVSFNECSLSKNVEKIFTFICTFINNDFIFELEISTKGVENRGSILSR
jgi:hypothetical protein